VRRDATDAPQADVTPEARETARRPTEVIYSLRERSAIGLESCGRSRNGRRRRHRQPVSTRESVESTIQQLDRTVADLGAKLDGIKQAVALDKQVDERLAKFTEL
jgi:hypothetical protein